MNKKFYMISLVLKENKSSTTSNQDYSKIGEKIGKSTEKAISIISKITDKKTPKTLKLLRVAGKLGGKLIDLKKKKQELPSKITS